MAGAIPSTQPALPVCGAVALVTAMPLVFGRLAVLLCFFYSPAASVTPVGLYCAPVPFVPLTPVAPLEPSHFFYRPTSSVTPPLCPHVPWTLFGPVRVRLLTIHRHMERYQAKRLVVGHLLTCLGNQKNTSREHVRVFQHMQHLHLARTATCSSGCVFRIHNVSYDIHLKDREVNPSLPES